MQNLQEIKRVSLLAAGTTCATNADTTASFTITDAAECRVTVIVNPASATNADAKLLVLKLSEADGTTYTDISGFVGTTNTTAAATEFVIPVHNATAANQTFGFYLPSDGRQKTIKLSVRAGDTNNKTLLAFADLYGLVNGPTTASARGETVSVVKS